MVENNNMIDKHIFLSILINDYIDQWIFGLEYYLLELSPMILSAL